MKNAIALGALLGIISLSSSYGESTTKKMKQEAQEASRDAGRGVNKAGRNIEDSTCGLIHGKMECAAKKGVNSVKNGADKVKDAVE